MTKDILLHTLRNHFIDNIDQDDAYEEAELNDSFVADSAMTLGGVLHVAYLMHKSEEYLGEDKDYGELLLDTILDILYRYTVNLHGQAQINTNSELAVEMKEVFQWALDRFLEDWAAAASAGKIKPAEAELTTGVKKHRGLKPLPEGNIPVIESVSIPAKLANTDEYRWIRANWKRKEHHK